VSQENVEIVRAVTEAGKSPEAVERIGRGEFDLSFFLRMPIGARAFVPFGDGGMRRGETFSSTFRTTWTLVMR
jgi:hypothetical protein